MAKQSVNTSRVSPSFVAMEFLVPEEVEFIEVADDSLFQWEFVNVRDELEVGYADDDEDEDMEDKMRKQLDSTLDTSLSWSICPNEVDELIHLDVGMKEDNHPDDKVDGANGGSRQSEDVDLSIESRAYQLHQCAHIGEAYGYGEDDSGVDGYGEDEHDLNDELVPWSVSSKFGRQRMRKLGKRAFPKMNHSKRSPCLYMKPGCVRGKHGLGLKHSC